MTSYSGGIVVGEPELTYSAKGVAQLAFKVRDVRQVGEKQFVENYVVETWGDRAETVRKQVADGTIIKKLKGYPEARAYLDADGKPVGLLVVKLGELEVEAPARQAAALPASPHDPFGDQE